MNYRHLLLVVALSTTIFASGLNSVEAKGPSCTEPPPALGQYHPTTKAATLPDVPYITENGDERSLMSLRGRPLIVNFWATWCAPCVEELPALDRLSMALTKDRISVLPLSADREGASVIRKFFATNDISHLPIALDRQFQVSRSLAIPGLPTTVLYDEDGYEVGRVIGVAEWDNEKVIDFLRLCLKNKES